MIIEQDEDVAFPIVDGAYDANGVDLTLIDWLLALSPNQRLDVLQDSINFFAPFQHDVSNPNS